MTNQGLVINNQEKWNTDMWSSMVTELIERHDNRVNQSANNNKTHRAMVVDGHQDIKAVTRPGIMQENNQFNADTCTSHHIPLTNLKNIPDKNHALVQSPRSITCNHLENPYIERGISEKKVCTNNLERGNMKKVFWEVQLLT